jgi:hypothetical protein
MVHPKRPISWHCTQKSEINSFLTYTNMKAVASGTLSNATRKQQTLTNNAEELHTLCKYLFSTFVENVSMHAVGFQVIPGTCGLRVYKGLRGFRNPHVSFSTQP